MKTRHWIGGITLGIGIVTGVAAMWMLHIQILIVPALLIVSGIFNLKGKKKD